MLNFKLQQLQHELQQLEKLIFGNRQEKCVPNLNTLEQLSLAMAVDQTANVVKFCKVDHIHTNIVATPVVHAGRTKLPEHLRREEIILESDIIPRGSKKNRPIGNRTTEAHPCRIVCEGIYSPKILIYRVVVKENVLSSSLIFPHNPLTNV